MWKTITIALNLKVGGGGWILLNSLRRLVRITLIDFLGFRFFGQVVLAINGFKCISPNDENL